MLRWKVEVTHLFVFDNSIKILDSAAVESIFKILGELQASFPIINLMLCQICQINAASQVVDFFIEV